MAVLMLLGTSFTLFAPEPAERVVPPKSLKEAVWGPLSSFFSRHGAVEMLMFVMVYKLGDAIAAAMTTPFLLDLGFTRTDVGTVNKAFGLISTILGTLAGGSIIARIGINRSLWVFAFLQAGSNLAFTGLALVGKKFLVMVAAIGLENICGGMGTAAFVAFMMSLCDKRFTATQYALITSFMAVTRVLAGVPTGFMVQSLGWPMFYAVSVLGAVPGIALLPRFAPWKTPQGRGMPEHNVGAST
jgi:MFS transporter, PAT family, beta-lactamase induction signal transducer AmpG